MGAGNALLGLGSVDAAVIELERAVASAPSFASAHAGLGRALAARPGEGARAERALSEALALDPRHLDARAALGALHYRAGRWDAAAQTLREGTRYPPLEASLWFDLAQAERRAGRAPEARPALDRVLGIDPGDEAARAARAALP